MTQAVATQINKEFEPGRSAGIGAKPELLVAAGAISIAVENTKLAPTSGADVAFTLADGVESQKKRITLMSKGAGNAVVTPANLADGTTVTLNTALDVVELVFLGTEWVVTLNKGCAVA